MVQIVRNCIFDAISTEVKQKDLPRLGDADGVRLAAMVTVISFFERPYTRIINISYENDASKDGAHI